MARASRLLAAATATLAVASGLATVAPAAGAASAWPSRPASVHLAGVGHDWVSVTAARGTNVTGYRLFVSAFKADLWGTSLTTARATRSVSSATTPTVTVRNLGYRTGYIYYRYETLHGTNALMSDILAVSLRPLTPTAPVVHSGAHGLHLTWSGGVGTRTVIVQSTNTAMTAGRQVYTVRGQANQFTPYGMTRNVRYYFGIKAYNGGTPSAYAPQVNGVFQTFEQPVRVMTYNILTRVTDGQTANGEPYASWWLRRPAQAALIHNANPDVIGVQEGGSPVDGWKSPRQVDSLVSALGSTYTVARTEPLVTQPGYVLTGNYIVYRNTTWAAVGDGGHYYLAAEGSPYSAAWQVLRNRRTGAEALVVTTHMFSGNDIAGCQERARETTALINGANALAAQVRSGGVPIIYTGDFASAPASWLPDDSPGRLMHTLAGADDAYWAARTWRNDKWNSMNKYRRIVPLGSILIDRVFGTAGVAMHYWAQGVNQYQGKFVGVIPSDHNPVYADLSVQG